MADFDDPALRTVAAWAYGGGGAGGGLKTGVHVHVRDRQWRHVFTANDAPVHFDLPEGVRSITIEEGLLTSGYSIYRDMQVRNGTDGGGGGWGHTDGGTWRRDMTAANAHLLFAALSPPSNGIRLYSCLVSLLPFPPSFSLFLPPALSPPPSLLIPFHAIL